MMFNKEKYERVQLEITPFDAENVIATDVIVTSGNLYALAPDDYEFIQTSSWGMPVGM